MDPLMRQASFPCPVPQFVPHPPADVSPIRLLGRNPRVDVDRRGLGLPILVVRSIEDASPRYHPGPENHGIVVFWRGR